VQEKGVPSKHGEGGKKASVSKRGRPAGGKKKKNKRTELKKKENRKEDKKKKKCSKGAKNQKSCDEKGLSKGVGSAAVRPRRRHSWRKGKRRERGRRREVSKAL